MGDCFKVARWAYRFYATRMEVTPRLPETPDTAEIRRDFYSVYFGGLGGVSRIGVLNCTTAGIRWARIFDVNSR